MTIGEEELLFFEKQLKGLIIDIFNEKPDHVACQFLFLKSAILMHLVLVQHDVVREERTMLLVVPGGDNRSHGIIIPSQ